MPTMSIMTGNIGCGKSFLASKLARRDGAVVCAMDKLYELVEGRQDAQYDTAKKAIYQSTEDALIRGAFAAGLDVVVDRTLMQANRRKHFIDIGKELGARIVSYNWGAGTEADLHRRQERPRGVPAAKWSEVFTFMREQYEEPELVEGFDEILVPPPKYKFYAFDFDGTIVENATFPAWGEIISGTVEKMNALYDDLKNVIIVWSCRSGDFENEMRRFLLEQKIKFDFINDNPFYPGRRKIFAHEYYDDRNAFL
jgi:predicted kinase